MKSIPSQDFKVRNISQVCCVKPGEVHERHCARFECCVILNCAQSFCLLFPDGRRLFVSENAAVFLPHDVDYTIEADAASNSYYVVSFTLTEQDVPLPFIAHVKDKKGFSNLFKEIENEWEMQKPNYILKCKSLLYAILHRMLMAQSDYVDNTKKDILHDAVEYMQKHYSIEELKLSKLADICGVSPEYFRRIFKSVYGVSPREYIKQLKMERAGKLLLSGERRIAEVAMLSGYNDLSNFSRKFKQFYGVSPTEYRNK